MLNNDQVKRQSIKSRDSRASSAPHANNENIFILDNNYSDLFGSKKKEQTDEEFKEIWDKLKSVQGPLKRNSNENINMENFSLKEEAMLGDEFLGMINSPTKSRRKESNLSSNFSEDDVSVKNRRISTGSISKLLKFNLDSLDDKETLLAEFREFKRKVSIKKNTPTIPSIGYDLAFKNLKERSIINNENHKVNEEMCSPLIELKDLKISNLNEEYENTDLLNKLVTSEIKDSNIKLSYNNNNPLNEKQMTSNNKTIYDTLANSNDTFKAKSETLSRQNFIPKDQLYKNSLNSIQSNSPNLPLMNNFQYYENTINNSNISNSNIPPNFTQKNDNFYQYPFNYNQTNNYYVKQQPNIQINSSILINNRPMTNMYNHSQPIINTNNNVNMNFTSYITPQPIKNIYQINNINYNYEGVNNVQQTHQNNKNKVHNKTGYLNYNEMDNYQLINNLDTIGRDQTGCRHLQKKIQEDKNFLNNYLYPNIVQNILQYMNDNFGNYLVQKIIEEVGYEKRKEIILMTQSSFLNLGLSPHGTRVIQKIIEMINTFPDLIGIFVQFFEPHLLTLIKDVNGNHIIIKFVNTYKSPINDFIYNQLNDNVVDISTDKHGCCAIQKCIDAANEDQKITLVANIIKNTNIFILNQYANYVLQLIVTLGNQIFNRDLVLEILKNNIDFLSKQRFSSNVIEKCFDFFSPEYQALLIKEIAKEEIITSLLFNMYGNYVLQKALQLSSEPYYTTILTHISKNLESLKNFSSFGSKLYFKLISTYPVLNNFRHQQPDNNQFIYNNQNHEGVYFNNVYNGAPNNNINDSFNSYGNRINRKIPRKHMNMNMH